MAKFRRVDSFLSNDYKSLLLVLKILNNVDLTDSLKVLFDDGITELMANFVMSDSYLSQMICISKASRVSM